MMSAAIRSPFKPFVVATNRSLTEKFRKSGFFHRRIPLLMFITYIRTRSIYANNFKISLFFYCTTERCLVKFVAGISLLCWAL